jgi:hypothetical protein
MDVSNCEMVEFGVEIRQRYVSRQLLSVVMPGPVVNRQALPQHSLFYRHCFEQLSPHPAPSSPFIHTEILPACLPSPNSAEAPPLS